MVVRWHVVPWVLAVGACAPNLGVTSEGEISCGSENECPSGLICAQQVGRCVGGLEQDPPEIVSVAATSPTSAVVAFNERLWPSSILDGTQITFLPALEVFVVSLEGEEASTLTVTTSTQLQGHPYVIEIRGVQDLQGNTPAMDPIMGQFAGFGPPADTTAPDITSPQDGRVVPKSDIELVWTPRAGIANYEIQMARDAGFTDILALPTSTTTPDEPLLTVESLPDGDYFWRVRTDLSDWTTAEFSILTEAVHVYCEEGMDCSESTGERGTVGSPFRSVQRAAAAGRSLNLGTVRIAARGGGSAYNESLVVADGILEVIGGYDASFAASTRDAAANETRLSTSAPHFILSVTRDTRIEGLTLETITSTPLTSVVRAEENVGVVNLEDLIVRGTALTTDQVLTGVEITQSSGVDFEDVRVEILGTSLVGRGVILRSSQSTAENLSIQTDTGYDTVIGVEIDDGTFTADILTLELQGGTALGFSVGGPSVVALTEARVRLQGGVALGASIAGTTTLTVGESVWEASGSTSALGIASIEGASLDVRNSILVSAANSGAALSAVGSGSTTIVHSTLIGDATTDPVAGIPTSDVVATNNLFVSLQSSTCWFGATAPSFQNNAFVGCTTMVNTGSQMLNDATSLNALDGGGPGSCATERVEGNLLSSQTLAEIFVDIDGADDDLATLNDNDYGLLLTVDPDSLRNAGRATDAIDCGPCSNLVSCGNVQTDIAGVNRDTVPTVGAHE